MVKAALLRMRPRRLPLKFNRPPLMPPNAWDASMDIKPKQKKLPLNLQKTSRDLPVHLAAIHVPNVLIAVLTTLKIKILKLS